MKSLNPKSDRKYPVLPYTFYGCMDVKMNPKISLLILLFLFVSTVSTFNITCEELDETSE